jgi:ethanolamine utilization microcompartment shell protein EutS
METERQPEQPVLSDDVASPEDAVAHPTDRRLAYKTMLDAVIIGILTISALWLFVMRLEESPVVEALVTASDEPMYEDTATQHSPAPKTAPAVESIGRELATLSGRIEWGFEAQQTNSLVVKREFSVMAESLQTIKAAIAELGESHKALGRQVSEATSRLDMIVKDVQVLKVVKRKPTAKHKPRPVKTPPFHIDAIDVWDDMTYAAVSQKGHVSFLKTGEQKSGWTVTHINRPKGQVDFKGPAGQAYSVSLQR